MRERKPFVHLFVGLILTVTGTTASCPIELSPPRVVVRYGDPVTVNCSTSLTDHGGLGWEAQRGGTGIEMVNVLPWTVESLTEWNMSPFCYFNFISDDQCKKDLPLTIYKFPERISIRSSRGPMVEGETYVITCEIADVAPVGHLKINWYQGDTVKHTETFADPTKEPVNLRAEFKFEPTKQDNGTVIRCEALMDLGPEEPKLNVSSEEYVITVYWGPDVSCSLSELREGEILNQKCNVTGNPTPDVKWSKDGKFIDPSVPLRREDSGRYTIEAEGSSVFTQNTTIHVLYGPDLRCPSTYTALEYAPLNLTCTVEGFPRPNVTWYKDGEEVELPDELTRRDAGKYVVTASNQFSSVNSEVEVIVLYPLSPIVELEDSEVDVGSTVWLKCSSTGNPRPKYSWTYYQTNNVVEESEDGVSLLTIHNATAHNSGFYTCLAWNDEGNVTRTVKVTVKGAEQECPIEITPNTMVVQYQSRGTYVALCKPTSTNPQNVQDYHWADKPGSDIWIFNTEKDWDVKPACTAKFQGRQSCSKELEFILYKTPDSVSIHQVDNSTAVLEDKELQLQCDVINVAPAQNVSVRWYRGNESIGPGLLRLSDCPDNNTDCVFPRSPVNVSSVISVTLNRKHNGAQFRCEAELILGPEGSTPPLITESSPLNLTVCYKPVINTTKLPKKVPVFRGYPEELVCEADGHPPPKIQWLYSLDKVLPESEGKLTVYEAGFYNCSARNDVDATLHVVEVILKEDYLPLIAGFVAVTVVAISIIFLFIFSIYYKNTKMRRYNLKNPKLSTHNGNVAHNGWDMQFPMTKLS